MERAESTRREPPSKHTIIVIIARITVLFEDNSLAMINIIKLTYDMTVLYMLAINKDAEQQYSTSARLS